jgi:ribosomal protein S18 acetylase RimI-like enzyme
VILEAIADKKVLQLEELSMNSWPALRRVDYDGWILRLANRFTNRANSVWSLYGSNLKLEDKVDHCERFYSDQGQPTVFRIVSDDSRKELDDYLQRRGYTVVTPTLQQMRTVTDLAYDAIPDGITVDSVPDDSWANDVAKVTESPRSLSTYLQILKKVVGPLGLFRAHADDKVIGVALGAAEDKFVGLAGMQVHPSYRRQGWGRKLMAAMIAWGRSQGAETVYFQVEADNASARALYDNLGFEEVYRYWYRVKKT